jgi:hypothetical protein
MKGRNFFGKRAHIEAAGVRWYVGDKFSIPSHYYGTMKVVAVVHGDTEQWLSCINLLEVGTTRSDARVSYTFSKISLEWYFGRDLLYSEKLESW